jgi:hypothetical protein
MQWRDVCFMHWRADAAPLRRALPRGIELDLFAGEAWVSVVPFRLTGVRPRGLPVLPGFRDVPEINLRTYVRVGGVPGIWFFSLDASSPIAVRAARAMTALAYFDARITTRERDETITYESERTRGPGEGRFRARYTPAGEARACAPDSLDAFLHERYRFFAVRGSRILTAEVRHEPWHLQAVTVDIEENSLGKLAALELPRVPDRVAFSRGFGVRATAASIVCD